MQVNQGNPKTLLVCLRSISSVSLACADRQKIISCIESLHDNAVMYKINDCLIHDKTIKLELLELVVEQPYSKIEFVVTL
jgi:hypothetical protein